MKPLLENLNTSLYLIERKIPKDSHLNGSWILYINVSFQCTIVKYIENFNKKSKSVEFKHCFYYMYIEKRF